MNQYIDQANNFLADSNLSIKITKMKPQRPLSWDKNHRGAGYWVTLRRSNWQNSFNLRDRFRFDFWGSVSDLEAGQDPTAYEVLAAIAGQEQYAGYTHDEFCKTFGYSDDSIQAKQVYTGTVKLGQRMLQFFTPNELNQLSTIQ
jgi:hypothetical protein